MRVEARGAPDTANYSSLTEYVQLRTSCWIVEQVGNEFYCDCHIGITGDICKHTMALHYDRMSYPVLDTLQPKKLNNLWRKVERPAKIKPAFSRAGPSNVITVNDCIEIGNEEVAVVVVNWDELNDVNNPPEIISPTISRATIYN